MGGTSLVLVPSEPWLTSCPSLSIPGDPKDQQLCRKECLPASRSWPCGALGAGLREKYVKRAYQSKELFMGVGVS